jgi:ankyrin repeat protein
LQPIPVNSEIRIDLDPTKSDLWWADGIATLSSETIAQKLQQGAKIDSINPDWYGWEALHYAARTTDPDKLKVICDNLPRDKINTLTMLSENALHILLDHGVLGQSFNITCQNGTDLKTSKIINQEEERIVKCAEILIDAGIDVNHNNFWNDTPLLIAIKRKYFTIVEMLLEKDDIDLDSCRGTVSGKSARELLRGRKKMRKLKTKALPTQPSTHTKILFRLLKSGDEEAFLKYNGGKIRDILKTNEDIDGDNVANSSCTLLQYCFRRGLIAWHQEQARCESDSPLHYQDTTANRLVQIFCQNGMVKCIQHLLDNGADIDFTLRKFEDGKTLLQAAIVKGYYPLIAVILGRTEITFDPNKLCPAIVELLESTTHDIDLNCTLSIVLNRLLISETPLDENGIVILNQIWKLERGLTRSNKENVLLLLKFSGSLNRSSDIARSKFLCWWNNDITNKALEKIGPEVIQKHLDECVEQQENKVCINFGSFINKGSVEQVLRTFVSSPVLNVCLNHFVFKILIMQKWEKLRFMKIKYFYLNLLSYVIFYLLLNVYIFCKFNKLSNPGVDLVYGLGWICLLLFVAKEFFELLAFAGAYFSEFSKFPEIFFIVTTYLVYSADKNLVGIVEVLSILSSTLLLVLLLLLVQVPKFSSNILRSVLLLLMYTVFYLIKFVAFAICFYIFLGNSQHTFWIDVGNKVFDEVMMFTGKLDNMESPWKNQSSSNDTSQDSSNNFSDNKVFLKLIALVILCMGIILNNLLLSFLVADIENVNKRVKLFEQLNRASFVVRLEKFLDSAYLRCLPNCILDRFHSGRDLFKDNKYVFVNINDKKMIDDDGKEHLNFILTKREKRQDSLKKLYRYITAKVNEQSYEGNRHHVNSAVLEKLELVEERLKNLHEITEVMKVGLHKNR